MTSVPSQGQGNARFPSFNTLKQNLNLWFTSSELYGGKNLWKPHYSNYVETGREKKKNVKYIELSLPCLYLRIHHGERTNRWLSLRRPDFCFKFFFSSDDPPCLLEIMEAWNTSLFVFSTIYYNLLHYGWIGNNLILPFKWRTALGNNGSERFKWNSWLTKLLLSRVGMQRKKQMVFEYRILLFRVNSLTSGSSNYLFSGL